MGGIKIVHTADWHLGQSLHGFSREYEHREFLVWLADQLQTEKADALIIAGDIYDSANPPAYAQSLFYDFLAQLHQRLPQVDVVVIGGNHDSASRLDAPQDLLAAMRVHVIGGMPRDAQGQYDMNRLLVPLHNNKGEMAAMCVAMPFLRQADLPYDNRADDPLIEGVRTLYEQAIGHARDAMQPGMRLVVTGHCYMTGNRISELSERKVLGGNQHALPADIFPVDADYVALGHMHLAQAVGSGERIRYCGSPIPLSMAEREYPHQIGVVDIDSEGTRYRAISVPRKVGMLCVPEKPATLEKVISQLKILPKSDELDSKTWPLLEVRVLLDEPRPDLRQKISKALTGRKVRLAKITTSYPAKADTANNTQKDQALDELTPEQVFQECYFQRYGNSPADELSKAFHDLVDQVSQESSV